MSERQDFKKWQIDLAYESTEGLCPRCGAGLDQTGFHVHHRDGDNSNTRLENIELLCPKCHFTTFKGAKENQYEAHKNQETMVLTKLNELIVIALDPASKMSGATAEKLIDAMTMSLKTSRNINEIDYGKLQTPAYIRVVRKMAENEAIAEAYQSGFMDGMKKVLSSVATSQQESK